MKFRAILNIPKWIKHFQNIFSTLSKFGLPCIFQICTDKVIFIIYNESSKLGKQLIRCVIHQSPFFQQYNMVGVANDYNEIFFEMSHDMLANAGSALKASLKAKAVKVKLTQKKAPCLTFEVDLMQSRMCSHDFPVRLIRRSEWSFYKEPSLPVFKVAVHLPDLRMLKTIVTRMRSINQTVSVSANREGTLLIRAETDKAAVTTHFNDQTVEQTSDAYEDPKKMSTVKVDSVRFLLFLGLEKAIPERVVVYLANEKLLYIVAEVESIRFEFYAPDIGS